MMTVTVRGLPVPRRRGLPPSEPALALPAPVTRLALAFALVLALVLAIPTVAAAPRWVDATAESGIDFLHSGYSKPTLLVEQHSGACFADLDGDGYEDLFLTNGRYNDSRLQSIYLPTSRVFRNAGDGTFLDVTEGSGAAYDGWGQGCSAADYDADGDLDLFVAAWGESALFRNEGGFRFTNVTDAAGLRTTGMCAPWDCFSTGSAWADVNGDECLDLYVADYGNWTYGVESRDFRGQRNLYFESRCDGTFVERAVELGLDDAPSKDHSISFQPMWLDYDGDGDLDLYVTADGVPNSLLAQEPDGTFVDRAGEAGVDDPRAGMGLEVEDIDGDLWPDLYMTHYESEHNGFYTNNRDGTFRDRSGEGNLSQDWGFLGWATAFLDYDLDGDLDVWAVNGHTSYTHKLEQSRLLFRNDGDFEFTNVTAESGPGITRETIGRGAAYADYDFDGDLDFVVNNVFNTTTDFARAEGATGNFLEVQLRQPGKNPRAIGALVTVTPDDLPAVRRTARAGASFLSQNSEYLHFGLGGAAGARVEVIWPDGAVEVHERVEADRVVRITRGGGVVADTLAPVTTAVVTGPRIGGWYPGGVQLVLTVADRGVPEPSGIANVEYRIGGGDWIRYEAPVPLGGGVHAVEYRATDAVGNVEPLRSMEIRVDASFPETRLRLDGERGNGWFLTVPEVTLEASDEGSGLDRTEHRIGEGPWTLYFAPFVPDLGEGVHALEARSVDRVGNEERAVAETLRIDLEAPATTPAVEGPVLRDRDGRLLVESRSRIALAAADAASGVARTVYRFDDGPERVYHDPVSPGWSDGDVAFRYASEDVAGHREEEGTLELRLDNTRPPPVQLHARALSASAAPSPSVESGALAPLLRPLVGLVWGEETGRVVAGSVRLVAESGPDVSGIAWTSIVIDGVEVARAAGPTVEHDWDAGMKPGLRRVAVLAADGRGNVAREDFRYLVFPPGGSSP